MKSLVTGGCGFIGSRLVEKLIKNKDGVIVIDNNSSNSDNNFIVDGAKYYNTDLNDFEKILPLFKGVDRVFHLAADVSIDFCNKNPRTSGINNSNITLNTLECCRLHNVKKYVFSSTSAVYLNKQEKTAYKETDETEPLNLYSASKLFGENLCKIYYNLYEVETVILRYFNVFGPSMNISPYSSVIVNFLNSKKYKKPLSIHGTGEQTRDFVFIDDVVSANILASQTQLKKYGSIFNVGTGKSLTINKLSKIISKERVFLNPRKADIKHSLSSIKKIKKELNWKPTITIESWLKQNN